MSSQGGERTEKPSAKRIKDAREKGQVARSRDLASAASLIGATLVLGWFGAGIVATVGTRLAEGIRMIGNVGRGAIDPDSLTSFLWADAWLICVVAGPPVAAAALMSVAGSFAQVGWAYSPKALHVNWGRLNPASGFAKLGPKQAMPELVKALASLAALGVLTYAFVRPFVDTSIGLASMHPMDAARVGWDRVWTLLWRSSLLLAVLAVGDYGLQWWRWHAQLKMTRQDVRDESRMQDGSPEIKARVRRVQRDMARRRMLHAVKTATVVVTNPTHYAVALDYKREEMAAPVVVAKGQDLMAARIRAVAVKHEVPVVENVSLARALYNGVDVGDAIPSGLFGAVAEVLAYLVRLKKLIL